MARGRLVERPTLDHGAGAPENGMRRMRLGRAHRLCRGAGGSAGRADEAAGTRGGNGKRHRGGEGVAGLTVAQHVCGRPRLSGALGGGGDAVFVTRLCWDASAPSAADADLQAVVVDHAGRIIDAAYYNNMKACGGRALIHTGDEGGAAGGRGQEELRFALAYMPQDVRMVLVVVCNFSGGTLSDALCAQLAFEQLKPTRQELPAVPIGLPHRGLLAAALVRGVGTSWQLRSVGEPLEGQHFMDCLHDLNRYIVREIPSANRRQKVAFAMDKGSNVDFGTSLDTVVLGLGWDVDRDSADLDASAVLMDAAGGVLESVFFGNLRSCGAHSRVGAIVHSGDNLTGEGDGDDEQITVQLTSLGEVVRDVFFCIHVYSKGDDGRAKTFRDIANAYCRVLMGGPHGEELCRYTLRDAGDRSGLLIARLHRAADGRFSFNALGLPSSGTMYKDAIPDMKGLSKLDPRQLQRTEASCTRMPSWK